MEGLNPDDPLEIDANDPKRRRRHPAVAANIDRSRHRHPGRWGAPLDFSRFVPRRVHSRDLLQNKGRFYTVYFVKISLRAADRLLDLKDRSIVSPFVSRLSWIYNFGKNMMFSQDKKIAFVVSSSIFFWWNSEVTKDGFPEQDSSTCRQLINSW